MRQKIFVDMTELASITPYLKGWTFEQGMNACLVLQPSLSLLNEIHLTSLSLHSTT